MKKYPDHRIDAERKWRILAKNWMVAPPPASPSEEDVENFFYDCQSHSTRVLVLGVTPALRVAANDRALVHLALDCTAEMIQASNALLAEEFMPLALLGDWLDMPFVDGSFDLVVGDKILGNLIPELWPKFFEEIERVLIKGGEFRTRATPNGRGRIERWASADFSSAVKEWANRINEVGLDRAVASLWEDRMNASIQSADERFGTQSLSRALPVGNKSALQAMSVSKEERLLVRKFLDTYWETRNLVWSAYCDEVITESETDALKFVGRRFASDYEAGSTQPCYIFRKEG